MRVKALFLKF